MTGDFKVIASSDPRGGHESAVTKVGGEIDDFTTGCMAAMWSPLPESTAM